MVSEEAESLAKFLTTVPQYGFNGKSPLVTIIETKIKAMATEIAEEVIAGNEELREIIRRKAKAVMAQALLEDSYLNTTITDALAKVLVKHALDQGDDD